MEDNIPALAETSGLLAALFEIHTLVYRFENDDCRISLGARV
jgi:hypothetical protein